MQKFAENLPKIPVASRSVRNLPESAGIYIFFTDKTPVYIGKAINLKRRVSSYFDLHLEPKTKRMVASANMLSFIQVTSELEAMLLEAKLIRQYMPRYNIAAKDDKHPLYIQITKEQYPRIITARKIAGSQKNIAFYGPFPSSVSVRSVLKMLRRIFPYSDHKLGRRACLYSQIGLCNPCPSEVERIKNYELRIRKRKEYLANIRHIQRILDGNIGTVKTELERNMKELSDSQDYEGASVVRDQVRKLEYITQSRIPTEYFLENPNLYEDVKNAEITQLQKIIGKIQGFRQDSLRRIECFDVAHLAGASPTASMVTFTKGEPDKKYYRHFRIYQKKSQSDVDSLKEVIKRRKNHFSDWGRPDLIIVDGGKAQVGVFVRELKDSKIPVVGLAKRFETLVIPLKSDSTLVLKEFRLPKSGALNLVQRIRNEAHRFARRYHHALIFKELTQS